MHYNNYTVQVTVSHVFVVIYLNNYILSKRATSQWGYLFEVMQNIFSIHCCVSLAIRFVGTSVPAMSSCI